jgi:hypothetical protein
MAGVPGGDEGIDCLGAVGKRMYGGHPLIVDP